MPFINVETNLSASKFPEKFLKKLCSTLAAALGKPEDVSIVALTLAVQEKVNVYVFAMLLCGQ